MKIYFVLFESKRDTETFVKVGITSTSVSERFVLDSINYNITIISETDKLFSPRQARALEYEIHNKLRKWYYRPKTRLVSGNTECYENILSVYKRVVVSGRIKIPMNKSKDFALHITGVKQKRYSVQTTVPKRKVKNDQNHLYGIKFR